MNNSGKTYYQILGVSEDAEDIVIRAAYKALAQKYHPDRWKGSLEEATRKMSEINVAYETLSDPVKKKAYDSTIERNKYQEEANDTEEFDTSIDKDWSDVLEYFPDLDGIAASLRKVSRSLEQTYKLLMLEKKLFAEREKVAKVLQQSFFERYFGTNTEIVEFAKICLSQGNKRAAQELNKAVNLLGSNIESDVIINKLVDKYFPEFRSPDIKLANEIIHREDINTISQSHCLLMIERVGGTVNKYGFISFVFDVYVFGKHYYGINIEKLRILAKDCAKKFLVSKSS